MRVACDSIRANSLRREMDGLRHAISDMEEKHLRMTQQQQAEQQQAEQPKKKLPPRPILKKPKTAQAGPPVPRRGAGTSREDSLSMEEHLAKYASAFLEREG